MKKFYLEEIKNNDYINAFEEIQNDFEQDDNDDWFTTDKADFDWWTKLADSIAYLEENNINYKDSDINELADYITIAEGAK
ncbi:MULTISPECIES: hypothetical protein [Streptococcus]|uniref:Uncharacterized protein n=1 Tax=Streptococcus equinus JB1 TaxID=1294274 RepID=A0A091BYS4_STREI|nr:MULTISPECIES: hypothetical protein [Streptococcus]EPV87530.1 hypothetical protein SAG0007_11545 [Streptococcus agalactiae FSL C1-487]KFN88912.1 hypothetical protein H702_00410 [Streptococcus equinus JB1]SFL25421.1 hypothetical protein SAMN02910290_01080 [Streptococcus equinus JB1]